MEKQMTPILFDAHTYAAEKLADEYIRQLASIRLGTEEALRFTTLEGQVETFRPYYAEDVLEYAARRGAYRCEFRYEQFVKMARSIIARRLIANPELSSRLSAVRKAQREAAAIA